MNGPELATLSTLAWVVLTVAVLVVFGTWSTGESWTILPGLVRGVRDWATEHAIARQATSPSPWAVTVLLPAAPEPEPIAAVEPAAEIEELGQRRLA